MQELAAVLKAARDNARQLDADAAFPRAAVDALHGSGLLASWPTGTPGADA